jgi:hypothetical protein
MLKPKPIVAVTVGVADGRRVGVKVFVTVGVAGTLVDVNVAVGWASAPRWST